MRKRNGMKPVYVGDIGEIVIKTPISKPTRKLDLENMSLRELFREALECGFDVRELIGVEGCDKHVGMVFLGGKTMPQGMNLVENCVYCKNCWQYFRDK